ncbi:MAG: hypothetical protein WA144_15505 [Candidatus Methanoperedens sp.]
MDYPKLNNRLYVGYTFKGCDVSIERALSYFDKYCMWKDYNREITKRILTGIYNIKSKGKKSPQGNVVCPLPSVDPKTIVDYFFSNTQPVRPLDVPLDNRDAAIFYYKNGFVPVPKKDGEKHPYVAYTQYRDALYPIGQIYVWNWSHGVCLLGTKNVCFLDIDLKGVPYFDISLLYGRHYERTPSGGYHVFGYGNLKNDLSLKGIVEIKGNTNLIVAYPTSRYKISHYV